MKMYPDIRYLLAKLFLSQRNQIVPRRKRESFFAKTTNKNQLVSSGCGTADMRKKSTAVKRYN